jgi:putative transposase
VIRAHKIALKLNNKQKTHLAKACGVARFSYNWGLAEWMKAYAAGEKVNEMALRRKLNSIKKEQFPWMQEVSKCAPQMAIKELGKAFVNFFEKRAGYPKFKKKGHHDSFTLSNDHFRVIQKKVRIPHLGMIKMREDLRFEGKPLWATLSRHSDRWFISISVELPEPTHAKVYPLKITEPVGVDLGIKTIATLSTGKSIANPNALETRLKKLKTASKALSRKKQGSKNRLKAKRMLSRLHKKIVDVRIDAIHKFTTDLSQKFDVICLEDLNVKGMTRNKHLSRRLSDSSFGEIRRQLEYKTKETGGRVLFVPRFYPSSKLCSQCLEKNESLTLADRQWTCAVCGASHDRDINAAINIKKYAVSYTVAGITPRKACGEKSAGLSSVMQRSSETVFDEAGTKHQSTT